jgi:hypothetical protein
MAEETPRRRLALHGPGRQGDWYHVKDTTSDRHLKVTLLERYMLRRKQLVTRCPCHPRCRVSETTNLTRVRHALAVFRRKQRDG